MNRSAIYQKHVDLNAQMADQSQWQIPLVYSGVLDEVSSVSSAAGLCDVSHIGRIRIRGSGAIDLLERICTAGVAQQEDDTAILTLLCNARGGIIDCCYLLRMDDDWLLTCDGGNRQRVLDHITATADDIAADVKITDRTLKTTQIAIAGPAAGAILDNILPSSVSNLGKGEIKIASYLIAKVIASRTGYTGRWGVEVIVPNLLAGQAWEFLMKKKDVHLTPFGSASRDVMRIEAGFVKFGHEINETIDPISASLEKAVQLDHDFIGINAIEKIAKQAPARKLVKLHITDSPNAKADISKSDIAIAKHGCEIFSTAGVEIGAVTSGAFSPSKEKIIALGYVSTSQSETGNEVLITINGKRVSAEIADQ